LKTFQIAQLIYDITVRFCHLFIDKRSRTRDQMVQAARSGVQNIAEASMASGTSRKTELKLTNVARASLEELRLDYEDFLRQNSCTLWPADHPSLKRFKAKRCSTLDEVRAWIHDEQELAEADAETHTNTDHPKHARPDTASAPSDPPSGESVPVRDSPCSSVPTPVLVANAALSLLNLCSYLLDRQISAQAATFEEEGGFTERLHRVRRNKRDNE